MSGPASPAESPTDPPAGASPMLSLLASGLQLWIRQQCEAVESLDLQLHGSTLQLLRGRLEGVTLEARRVVYRELSLESVRLTSAPIQVRMGSLLKGQGVRLEHPFAISGTVAFSSEGLLHGLTRPPWGWLGDLLARELLGREPLEGLRISGEQLLLSAGAGAGDGPDGSAGGSVAGIERATVPLATAGTIEIRALEGEASCLVPMDPAIRIDTARIEEGTLRLDGEARVSP